MSKGLATPGQSFGHDPLVSVFCYLGFIEVIAGRTESTTLHIARGRERAEVLAHANTLGYIEAFESTVSALGRDYETLAASGARLAKLVNRDGLALMAAFTHLFQGVAKAWQGSPEGLPDIQLDIVLLHGTHSRIYEPLFQMERALALRRIEQPEAANQALERTFEVMESSQEYWAEERGHRAWRLRATIYLARQLQATGQRPAALTVLTPELSTFVEEQTGANLIEARSLLD